MTPFLKIAAAGVLEFVIGSITGILFRRRAGVSIPAWVHVIAAVSFIVGVGLVWQSQEVGGTDLWRDLLAPFLLPVFAYLSYGFYGARYLRGKRRDPPRA